MNGHDRKKTSSAGSTKPSGPVKASTYSTTAHSSKDRLEHDIRSNLYRLISRTQASSTICPSQVARAMHADDPKVYPDWRALMDPVRDLVWGDVKVGKVQVTQKGEVREYAGRGDIRGPIRVKRGPKWDRVDIEADKGEVDLEQGKDEEAERKDGDEG